MSNYKSYDRTDSPVTVINRNGSRYTAPIDILRSESGRAEIMRQRSREAVTRETAHSSSDQTSSGNNRDHNR